MTPQTHSPGRLQVWLWAARPRTLPAVIGPVIVGTAAAFSQDSFRPGPALAALTGGLLLQIGTNLANDVFDFKTGADATDRLGPLRVTQAGLLTPQQVLRGMWLVFGLAALLGLYLAAAGGWPVIVIGGLSVAAAIAYTGGPFPLGYHGLGDLFVFIFFGPVAVCGTYYVQARTLSATAIWASAPVGLLATAILVVNNLRDIETDRAVGKRTLAVRLGQRGARIEYLLLVGLAYAAAPILWWAGVAPWSALLCWLSLPLLRSPIQGVWQQKGRPLNKALADTARLELVYSLLFSIGLVVGHR
ncbi:MAG: 1,4-dihydroxy-2-naphthoate polyprenyltransferase [Chloroflexota bacterium]